MTSVSAATTRLLATADALPDPGWSAPSHCAGWTRAHVLAHLALNAEALTGVVRGLLSGEPTPMYVSDEARDGDIADLAAAAPDAVRERLGRACTAFAEVVDDDPATLRAVVPLGTTFQRTPGGRLMSADDIGFLRLREVEVHHADLAAGYSWTDWPVPTARRLLADAGGRGPDESLHLRATDLDESWTIGHAAARGREVHTVSGPVRALAWWATGRDPGPVLSSTEGTLPSLEV